MAMGLGLIGTLIGAVAPLLFAGSKPKPPALESPPPAPTIEDVVEQPVDQIDAAGKQQDRRDRSRALLSLQTTEEDKNQSGVVQVKNLLGE